MFRFFSIIFLRYTYASVSVIIEPFKLWVNHIIGYHCIMHTATPGCSYKCLDNLSRHSYIILYIVLQSKLTMQYLFSCRRYWIFRPNLTCRFMNCKWFKQQHKSYFRASWQKKRISRPVNTNITFFNDL